MKTKHDGTTEVSPPGWKDVVDKLQAVADVDNPWATAWAMKGKGDKRHKKDEAVSASTLGQVVRGGAAKRTIESLREASGRLIEAAPVAGDDPAATAASRIFDVLLITEGLSANGENYYGPEAILSCTEAFNGAAAYIDHPTKSGEEDQPERTVRALCGYYRAVNAVTIDGKMAARAQLVTDMTEAGQYAAAAMLSALRYEVDFPNAAIPHGGLSINAGGIGEERMMDLAEGSKAVNYVLQITKKPNNSVDIVTVPARGGRVLECLESLRTHKEDGKPMKKLIESLVAAFKAAKEAKDPKVTAAKLAEAEKTLTALVEADADGAFEAMCAKQDGESDEAHQARVEGMHGALSKMLGNQEGSTLGNDDPEPAGDGAAAGGATAGDELHAKGKGAVAALLKGKEAAEAREARRLAVKQLIAESKIPEKFMKALNVEALSRVPLTEAKAQIASFKAFAEAARADHEEVVATGAAKLAEAGGAKKVGIDLSECVKA